MAEKHIHDCTGPDATCPCGYVFSVPRFHVLIEVHDGKTDQVLINEAFNCDSISLVLGALYGAAYKLERIGYLAERIAQKDERC